MTTTDKKALKSEIIETLVEQWGETIDLDSLIIYFQDNQRDWLESLGDDEFSEVLKDNDYLLDEDDLQEFVNNED